MTPTDDLIERARRTDWAEHQVVLLWDLADALAEARALIGALDATIAADRAEIAQAADALAEARADHRRFILHERAELVRAGLYHTEWWHDPEQGWIDPLTIDLTTTRKYLNGLRLRLEATDE